MTMQVSTSMVAVAVVLQAGEDASSRTPLQGPGAGAGGDGYSELFWDHQVPFAFAGGGGGGSQPGPQNVTGGAGGLGGGGAGCPGTSGTSWWCGI